MASFEQRSRKPTQNRKVNLMVSETTYRSCERFETKHRGFCAVEKFSCHRCKEIGHFVRFCRTNLEDLNETESEEEEKKAEEQIFSIRTSGIGKGMKRINKNLLGACSRSCLSK